MSLPILPDAPNSAHSPTPWRVEQLEDDYGFMPIFGVWHPESNSGENTVCNVFSIADANLIAAAPDLLEMLKHIMRIADSPIANYADESENDEINRHGWFESARDLIAKAQGDAQC